LTLCRRAQNYGTRSGQSRLPTPNTARSDHPLSGQAQQAREALGARLREIRKDADLTGRALAALAGWQLPKVSKIEHGRQNASEDDIRVWCRSCHAEDQ